MKNVLLFGFVLTLSLARVNPLMTQGENISDIGSRHSQFVEVPIERISYPPQMHFVSNELIYAQRELNKATCAIDAGNHEACPIDKKECEIEKEYTTGSAERGEGYISCTQLDVNSYYDPARDKCVLPPVSANVCRDFEGTSYDPSRDICVKSVTRALPEDVPEKRYGTLWSTGNSDPRGYGISDNIINLKSDWGYPGEPGSYHCGNDMNPPSSITIDERVCNIEHSGMGDVPCTEVTNRWGRLPSGGYGLLNGCYCVTDGWGDGDTYENPDANGMCRKFIYHSGDVNICDWWADDATWQDYTCPAVSYSCEDDEAPSTVNGERLCTKEVSFAPKCSGGFFPTRDRSECLGERLKYDYFTYSCPLDTNVYGNVWDIVDPGGDCGEYSLSMDTNGDGIKDRCNAPTPSSENCERTTYRCSFNPDAICVLDEKEMDYNDFTKWTVENYMNRASSSEWEVLNKNSVIQKINGYPTYFLSNYELRDGHITMQGTFKTDDPWDNDWFGFVFGFKDSKNYYLLDWSRWKNDNWRGHHDANGNPIDGAIPLTLSKATNLSGYGYLWSHTDSEPNFKVLQRKDNGGWSTGVEYNIKIDVTKHDIKVWIGEVGSTMNLDINYHSDAPMDITGKLGFYNFSISKVTYKDFVIEWVDGEDVDYIKKSPLVTPAQWRGGYKEEEYGTLREDDCVDATGKCIYALSEIKATGNRLCFKNKAGTKGCFEAEGGCRFEGFIDDTGVYQAPIFSTLVSSDEVVPDYHRFIAIDYDSPSGISLDFSTLGSSHYPLGAMKATAENGDKITVDFWLFWRGGQGMPVGFSLYDLWIRNFSGKFALGFNTGKSDVFGIGDIDFLKNSWHRITAIFTHKNFMENELYIDGVKQILRDQDPIHTFHDNTRADITKTLQLSGWTRNNNYSLDAKIAGIKIYDGALTSDQIRRLHEKGMNSGISRLEIDKHFIYGYDADDMLLGEINSTCELSGKVGFYAKTATQAVSSIEGTHDDGDRVFFSNKANELLIAEWGRTGLIRVDTSKKYIMSGTMSIYGNSSSSSNPAQYAGFVSFDIDKKIIYPYSTMKVAGSADTIMSKDLKPGDTSFTVDDATGWYDGDDIYYSYNGGPRHYYSRNFVWYGYSDSRGHVYEDYTYTRNYSGEDVWGPGAISQNADGTWTIQLKRPWSGPTVFKGVAVRNSSSGGTYNYVLLSGASLSDGVYDFSAHIGGSEIQDGSNNRNLFRPGTAYIAPLFIFNHHTDTPADVRWSNMLLSSESGEDILYIDKRIANPIVAAKIVDNRIEFWNSYGEKGKSGHIEIMKQVSMRDAASGYKYEFDDLMRLYNLGFTGFKSYANGMTYATSLKPMTINQCQEYLSGTPYYLAERNADDPIGLGAIKAFSSYLDGSFGSYCIIQRRGKRDNKEAEYAIRSVHKEKVYTSYFCSPWSCVDHSCGYASCPEGSFGDKIKEPDRHILSADSCIDQKCDINSEYFRYCGNPFGCDENDYTITKTDDGRCKKAECNGSDLFDANTGACEKLDCKYIEMDGKCYKKTY